MADSEVIVVVVVVALSAVFAFTWVAYLIKLALNDDQVQDHIRHLVREREEHVRRIEDKMRPRKDR